MRIVQTIAGIREDHGGTSRSVPALCEALAGADCEVHLVTGRPADRRARLNVPGMTVSTHYVSESRVVGRLFTGKKFRYEVAKLVSSKAASIVHDHGLWLPSNHASAVVARRLNVPRIVSPRGMLSQWALARGKWKKRFFWHLFQKRDLQHAAAFHATSELEAEDIRALGFKQPIIVVPNGVTVPNCLPAGQNGTQKTMLFLSRIHPKKGLMNLARAWATVPGLDDWQLVVAGPDEGGHQSQIQREVDRLGLARSVTFPGALDDHQKWQAYANADVFVLPSFSENFGIVIAEAMVAGLPVLTTRGTPWQVLTERNLGWWVEPNEKGLAEALRAITTCSPEELAAKGAAASRWARDQFAWERVAEQLRQWYGECV